MNSIGDIIDSLIDEKTEQLDNQELELVIDVFRNDFDKMTNLVKLFKKNKGKKGFEKSAYQTIAEMLFQSGVRKQNGSMLSVAQVNRYMGIVRAERVGTKSKAKAVAVPAGGVETQAVAKVVPELVARPGATKPVVAPAPVDAIPEKITGYDPMKKLQEWEKSKSFVDHWDDDDEILYGQLRRWVFKFAKDVSGQNVVGVCRKQFPNQTGFSKSLADTVELLFKLREKNKGHAHWTM
ncbi:hypothetical protein N7638_05655 [Achromobacter mucicolens]|uniref:hypothetical protein n=1 Tax=Achromobacter mucicolens TaxID=1389922 RepID=UPI0024480C2A|nr:hypothetical protein [Achromobacter mucicolens]MDG9967509.1 hypothetical protein [Achromobacter mucicolens]